MPGGAGLERCSRTQAGWGWALRVPAVWQAETRKGSGALRDNLLLVRGVGSCSAFPGTETQTHLGEQYCAAEE